MVTTAGRSPSAPFARCTRTGTGGSPGTWCSVRTTASERSGDLYDAVRMAATPSASNGGSSNPPSTGRSSGSRRSLTFTTRSCQRHAAATADGRHHAAVDREINPADEARVVGEQEGRPGRHLLGTAFAFDRGQLHEEVICGMGGPLLAPHRRIDDPWRDRADARADLAKSHGLPANQPVDTSFRPR